MDTKESNTLNVKEDPIELFEKSNKKDIIFRKALHKADFSDPNFLHDIGTPYTKGAKSPIHLRTLYLSIVSSTNPLSLSLHEQTLLASSKKFYTFYWTTRTSKDSAFVFEPIPLPYLHKFHLNRIIEEFTKNPESRFRKNHLQVMLTEKDGEQLVSHDYRYFSHLLNRLNSSSDSSAITNQPDVTSNTRTLETTSSSTSSTSSVDAPIKRTKPPMKRTKTVVSKNSKLARTPDDDNSAQVNTKSETLNNTPDITSLAINTSQLIDTKHLENDVSDMKVSSLPDSKDTTMDAYNNHNVNGFDREIAKKIVTSKAEDIKLGSSSITSPLAASVGPLNAPSIMTDEEYAIEWKRLPEASKKRRENFSIEENKSYLVERKIKEAAFLEKKRLAELAKKGSDAMSAKQSPVQQTTQSLTENVEKSDHKENAKSKNNPIVSKSSVSSIKEVPVIDNDLVTKDVVMSEQERVQDDDIILEDTDKTEISSQGSIVLNLGNENNQEDSKILQVRDCMLAKHLAIYADSFDSQDESNARICELVKIYTDFEANILDSNDLKKKLSPSDNTLRSDLKFWIRKLTYLFFTMDQVNNILSVNVKDHIVDAEESSLYVTESFSITTGFILNETKNIKYGKTSKIQDDFNSLKEPENMTLEQIAITNPEISLHMLIFFLVFMQINRVDM